MGLGPPVCKKCELVMNLDEERTPPWKCLKCGLSTDDRENTSSLFLYPREEWEFLQRENKIK